MSHQERHSIVSVNPLRFLLNLFGRGWLIAGGFGGLGGTAGWAFLEYTARDTSDNVTQSGINPARVAIIILSVLFAFLLAAAYQQWTQQQQQIGKLQNVKQELDQKLNKVVELALYEERRLTGDLQLLAMKSRNFREFAKGLEDSILAQFRELHRFIRVGVFLQGGLLSNDKQFTLVSNGGLEDIKTPKGILVRGEQNLAVKAQISKNQQEEIHTDGAQRTFRIGCVPIFNEHDSRVWGVLVVYFAERDDIGEIGFREKLDSLKRTFVNQHLSPAFEQVWNSEQKDMEMKPLTEGISYRRIHMVMSVVKNADGAFEVETDKSFPSSNQERTVIMKFVGQHKDLVLRALRGEDNIATSCKDYSLCIIPIVDNTQTKRVSRIVVVLNLGSYLFINEDKSDWDTMSRLVHHLCCGVYDPETSLYSQAAFRKHLSNILTKVKTIELIGVFLIDLEIKDADKFAKEKIGKLIHDYFGRLLQLPLAMVSRYDGLCYAFTLPVDSEDYAIRQGKGLSDMIRHSLSSNGNPIGVHIGIVIITGQCNFQLEDVISELFAAKSRAKLTKQVISLGQIKSKPTEKTSGGMLRSVLETSKPTTNHIAIILLFNRMLHWLRKTMP